MYSPEGIGHSPESDELLTRANTPGLSLRNYIERESAAIAVAGGPTMAEILDDLDRYRSVEGPTTDDIVKALHEGRRERDEQIDAWWRQ